MFYISTVILSASITFLVVIFDEDITVMDGVYFSSAFIFIFMIIYFFQSVQKNK